MIVDSGLVRYLTRPRKQFVLFVLKMSKGRILSSEKFRDKLQQMIRSEIKEMKERMDTLTASLEANKDEG